MINRGLKPAVQMNQPVGSDHFDRFRPFGNHLLHRGEGAERDVKVGVAAFQDDGFHPIAMQIREQVGFVG